MKNKHEFLIDTFNDVMNDLNIYLTRRDESKEKADINLVITTQSLNKLYDIDHDIFRYYGATKIKDIVFPFVLNVRFNSRKVILTTDTIPNLSMTEYELYKIINNYNNQSDYIKIHYVPEGFVLTSVISLEIISLQTGENISYTLHETLDLIVNRISKISYEYYYLLFEQEDILTELNSHYK